MQDTTHDPLEELWEAYRWATSDPGHAPNFMPELWARIEEARSRSWAIPLRRFAVRILPVAAAVTLVMGAYNWRHRSDASRNTLDSGYVDVLASELVEEQEYAMLEPI